MVGPARASLLRCDDLGVSRPSGWRLCNLLRRPVTVQVHALNPCHCFVAFVASSLAGRILLSANLRHKQGPTLAVFSITSCLHTRTSASLAPSSMCCSLAHAAAAAAAFAAHDAQEFHAQLDPVDHRATFGVLFTRVVWSIQGKSDPNARRLPTTRVVPIEHHIASARACTAAIAWRHEGSASPKSNRVACGCN